MSENFSQRLQEFRERMGYSREDAGNILGISGKYVGMIERGDKDVDPSSSLAKLFELIDRSPIYQCKEESLTYGDEAGKDILGEKLKAIAPVLHEAGIMRLRELQNYETITDLLLGLLRYDLLTRREHKLTGPISEMPSDLQQQVDRNLLDLVKEGGSMRRTTLLDYLISRAVNESGSAETTDDVIDRMTKHL